MCTRTHTICPTCLGMRSYLDTCLLGWEPRGLRSSLLCTGHSGRRLCCGCTSDICLSGGRSSRRQWGPRCCCTDRADKASLGRVPQRGPQSSHRRRAHSGRLEGTMPKPEWSSVGGKKRRRGLGSQSPSGRPPALDPRTMAGEGAQGKGSAVPLHGGPGC